MDWKILEEEIANDTLLKQIKADLVSHNCDHKGFIVANDRLLYKGRLVIPHNSTLISHLSHEYHDTPTGGHECELKTCL